MSELKERLKEMVNNNEEIDGSEIHDLIINYEEVFDDFNDIRLRLLEEDCGDELQSALDEEIEYNLQQIIRSGEKDVDEILKQLKDSYGRNIHIDISFVKPE